MLYKLSIPTTHYSVQSGNWEVETDTKQTNTHTHTNANRNCNATAYRAGKAAGVEYEQWNDIRAVEGWKIKQKKKDQANNILTEKKINWEKIQTVCLWRRFK